MNIHEIHDMSQMTAERGYDMESVRKWKEERIRQGISCYDMEDLEDYLTHILIVGLRHIADANWSYPNRPEFPDLESWQTWLRDTARMLERMVQLMHPDYCGVGVQKAQEMLAEGAALKDEVFDRLKKHFFDLWI